jgi:hypothetical protein
MTEDNMAQGAQSSLINIYMLTFNCGTSLIDVDAFASQLFTGFTSPKLPDLLVLSLQEIAPIPHSLIGGSFLLPYFERFYQAIQKASREFSSGVDASPVYDVVATQNLGMTAIIVFAQDSRAIKDIETGGVGLGIAEMGNKGATGIRFTYHANGSSTELTFVAAHLAAMESELQRRNADWSNIVRGLVFKSTSKWNRASTNSLSNDEQPLLSISARDPSIFKPTSHLFFSGDLNYRTSKFSPKPEDHLEAFPQPHHHESSPRHYSALFESDQLNQERLAGRTCHGLTEAQITFPPTYKYDPEEPFLTPDKDLSKWHWAKHRWPSWCDRILYLEVPTWLKKDNPDAKILVHKYSALPLFPTSDHRAVALDFSVPLIPIPSPTDDEDSDDPRIRPPFQLNPNWKTNRDQARMLELLTGLTMYLTTTSRGLGVLATMVIGTVGVYFAVGAMLDI